MHFNKNKIKQHSLFWLAYTVFWHFVWSPEWFDPWSIGVSLIYTLSNIIAAYTTIYVLVPIFLNKRQMLLFFVGMVGVLLAAAALNGALIWGLLYLNDPKTPAIFFADITGSASLLGSNSSAMLMALALQQYFRRKQEEDKREEIEKQNLETELKYLKSQLNPHFLFNALNSIYFLIKKDPELAADRLASFSDLLRHQLYYVGEEKINLQQELESLEKFTALEKLRMPDDLELSIKLPENVNGEMIVPFLLQPLVENAFKYASRKEGEIEIGASLKNDVFTLKVENNTGSEETATRTDSGIGLNNLRRRLELQYPSTHRLEIAEKQDRFLATLEIKLNQ